VKQTNEKAFYYHTSYISYDAYCVQRGDCYGSTVTSKSTAASKSNATASLHTATSAIVAAKSTGDYYYS